MYQVPWKLLVRYGLPVLWICNDLVRIWILLLRSFRIQILPFKSGQINKWQISNNDTAKRLLRHFKDLLRKYGVQQSKTNRKEEKLPRITQLFLSQRPDPDSYLHPDPVQLFPIQIRPGQKARNRPDPDPQYCGLPSPAKLKN